MKSDNKASKWENQLETIYIVKKHSKSMRCLTVEGLLQSGKQPGIL